MVNSSARSEGRGSYKNDLIKISFLKKISKIIRHRTVIIHANLGTGSLRPFYVNILTSSEMSHSASTENSLRYRSSELELLQHYK